MNIGEQPICLSGGAAGADAQWGMTAGMAGHQVIHFGFKGHRSSVPESEVVILTEEQLKAADPHLEKANESLQRRVPFDKPWIANLLRRNYYQIRDTQAVYAVAGFDKNGRVTGGTAWATQMYIDRKIAENDRSYLNLYVFDQEADVWASYDLWGQSAWIHLEGAPPPPNGVWTGIGSRDLKDNGKLAIRNLMGYTVPPISND